MGNKKYKVVIAESGKMDVIQKKRYILQQFQYREYAENFLYKIKKAAKELNTFPTAHKTTGFQYKGYDIYIKLQSDHLLFYTVDEMSSTVTVLRILQEDMDWRSIIEQWLYKQRGF